MAIAITEEHREIARVARSFLAGKNARAVSRAMLEAAEESLPPFWRELVGLGWTSFHLPESCGGHGFGLPELAVIAEEMGYALAPGPFLPTVWASAVVAAAGSEAQQQGLLPGLGNGERIGAVGIGGDLARDERGGLVGSAGLVLGAGLADMLLLRVGSDLVAIDRDQAGVTIEPQPNIDPGRRVALVRCAGVAIAPGRTFEGALAHAVRIGRTLAAAEAAGGAHACTEMATEYAKIRQQFGRTIGTFQAVKHHCANMRVEAERATAAAWDAARAELEDSQADFAAAVAASLAMPAFAQCGQLNMQVHGGIGFTWEHDVHLYIRRSIALAAIFSPDAAMEDVTRLAAAGVKRRYSIDLPPEAEDYRGEVRDFIGQYNASPKDQRRKLLADAGYLVPHWPKPWGRAAGAVEQLVIDQEFAAAGVKRPQLGISGWNTLTIAQHGTEDQVRRYVRASLEGEIEFCQLFSEPNAGSDAAGIQTRGRKVDGGWVVTGQKVWTSLAHRCSHGFATVRTDPAAAKHEGITMMVIDMHAKGVEVRPLRQATGQSDFNEVFFDEVFVADADVVGPVNKGWTVARATLGNERVSIGSGDGADLSGLLSTVDLMQRYAPDDRGLARDVGNLVAADVVIRLLNLRSAVRAVVGGEPGAEGNITKLLGSEQGLRAAALAGRIVGDGVASLAGDGGITALLMVGARAMAIAGGTSEIVRNQIAERILGLPRDPLLK